MKASKLVFEETKRSRISSDGEKKWVNVTVMVHRLLLLSNYEGEDSYYLIRCQCREELSFTRYGRFLAKSAVLRDASTMTDAMAIREAISTFDRMVAEQIMPFVARDNDELPF